MKRGSWVGEFCNTWLAKILGRDFSPCAHFLQVLEAQSRLSKVRNWLYRLRAMICFSRVHPHIEHAPDWTAEDAKILSKFLDGTQTGRRYRTILFHHIQSAMHRATMERNHATYECGYASGARGLAAVADSLLAVRAEKDDDPLNQLSPDLEALIP